MTPTGQQVAQAKAVLAASSGGEAAPAWIDMLTSVGDLVSKVAWPAIVAVVLWRLFPAVTAIVKSRAFSIEVAGMKVSVQEATEHFRTQIEDLQRQVIQLKERDAASAAEAVQRPRPTRRSAESAGPAPPSRILWVDDQMKNNAFEIAQLKEAGVKVIESSSTEDAMAILNSSPSFAAVISDMGRREGGAYRTQAGLILLRAMRAAGHDTPFMVYSSRRYADRNHQEVLESGGDGATSSPVDLLQWIKNQVPPESAARAFAPEG